MKWGSDARMDDTEERSIMGNHKKTKGLDFDVIDREALQKHMKEVKECRKQHPKIQNMLGGFTSPKRKEA